MLVGVVGGGQLGRMLGLAGVPMGMQFRFLDPSPDAPAGAVGELIVGAYDDPEGLARLAEGADVVTYEFENVPVAAARALAEQGLVLPAPRALEVAQDRRAEKELFASLGIGTAVFRSVDSADELAGALTELGTPSVLKTRRLGYDGKGQAVVRSPRHAAKAWSAVGSRSSILEELVAFDRELSVLAVRDRSGTTAVYPLVENHHREGILRRSIAPAPNAIGLQDRAEGYARAVLGELDYVGVLAIELFQVGDTLLANEMAPRVHNSGHWTIEGAETSQFENHLRAILGLPLGAVAARGASEMRNLIGSLPDPADVLAIPGAHLHRYGKAERPARKVGHVTVCASDAALVTERARMLDDLPGIAPPA